MRVLDLGWKNVIITIIMADIRREFKGREVEPTSRELENTKEQAIELPAEVKEILSEPNGPLGTPLMDIPEPGAPTAQPLTVQKEIETILESGLQKLYLELEPGQRQAFKAKGEIVAIKVAELMRQAKVKVQEIVRLILEWLKMLPGVSRYFLEQEAKIKAEKIIRLKQ